MSDRYAVEITIGGTLDRSRLPRLMQAICSEGLYSDWDDGEPPFEPETEDDLRDVTREGHLHLYDAQCKYGDMTQFTAVLTELGLSYQVECEGGGEYDRTLTVYDATTRHQEDYVCNSTGHPMVRRDEVDQLWRVLCRCRPFEDPSPVLPSVEQIRRKVRQILGPDIPELPPFELAGPKPVEDQSAPLDIAMVAETLKSHGSDEELDEKVIDVFRERASALNNQGMEAQLEFLQQEYGEELFRDLVKKMIDPGA